MLETKQTRSISTECVQQHSLPSQSLNNKSLSTTTTTTATTTAAASFQFNQ